MQKRSRANRRPIILRKTDKLSKEEKLTFFKEIANKGFVYNKDYEKCRSKINKLTSKKCYICGNTAYCMHHIIPLYSNGKNRKRNLIPICLNCHKFIHPHIN